MLNILLFSNLYFGIMLSMSVALFAAGWLHVDSWSLSKKHNGYLWRALGFFLLSIAFLIKAPQIENDWIVNISNSLRMAGLAIVFVSLMKEPILKIPKEALAVFPFGTIVPSIGTAILTFLVFLIYQIKATKGLEKQLKSVSVAFLLWTGAALLEAMSTTVGANQIFWSKLLAQGGLVWAGILFFNLMGTLMMAKWILSYLNFRPSPQIFLTFVTASLVIFLATTAIFSGLLFKNLENETLSQLETNGKTMQYALERLQLESLAHARSMAGNGQLQEAFKKKGDKKTQEVLTELLVEEKADFLWIVASSGEVIAKAEDPESTGESLVDNGLVKSALENRMLSTVTVRPGALYPKILINAAVPFQEGVLMTGFEIDNAFVDGVKEVTGLEVAIYGDSVRSATTILNSDGSRFIGARETNPDVLKRISEGQIYIGSISVLNRPFYAAYLPLKTLGDVPIGMLFVGQLQTSLLASVQDAIRITFLGSAILMLLSIAPSYLIAKHISENALA